MKQQKNAIALGILYKASKDSFEKMFNIDEPVTVRQRHLQCLEVKNYDIQKKIALKVMEDVFKLTVSMHRL